MGGGQGRLSGRGGIRPRSKKSWKAQVLKEAETGARWGLKKVGGPRQRGREDSPGERSKASVLYMGTGIRG